MTVSSSISGCSVQSSGSVRLGSRNMMRFMQIVALVSIFKRGAPTGGTGWAVAALTPSVTIKAYTTLTRGYRKGNTISKSSLSMSDTLSSAAGRRSSQAAVLSGANSRTKLARTANFKPKGTRKSILLPVVGYNANDISDYYDKRPWEVTWRLNSLGLPLLGWYIGLLFDQFMGMEKNESVQHKRGSELRQHLVNSGSVALVKSGQALSLRPDLLRNKIWAEELGKLVDNVGSFSDLAAMEIMKRELSDLAPRLQVAKGMIPGLKEQMEKKKKKKRGLSKLEKMVQGDSVLSLFEFYNDNRAVASASIGQVYKARIRRGPQLEAAIGKEEAALWGGKIVAIKIQRPNAAAAASLDMYLLRRTAEWASKFRGGDLPGIADQFGMQLFGELDYVREADNCERFRELYGDWENVQVPTACCTLTREKVLVMEWVDGVKGPWPGDAGIDMVRIGLRCSVDQLMHTGLFHADPHRGNLLKTKDGKLAFIDFGMMSDVSEEDRYGLLGLVIGLQNKDLGLVTEELLKLGFLKDTTQLDQLVPRLREALRVSTGGSGRASDVNFGKLQGQLDDISRDNVLKFSTPPFFTVIIRSLTILEGLALSVDSNFRLVRGAYPYVLAQLLSTEGNGQSPAALQNLLVRLLTVDGKEEEIEWETLREFLRLAQKASKAYDPKLDETNDKKYDSRKTVELFAKFLTSNTGLFLKKPLAHELAELIDGMASTGEANLMRISRGLIRPLPGGNGPINERRMEEVQSLLSIFQSALEVDGLSTSDDALQRGRLRMQSIMELIQGLITIVNDERLLRETAPLLTEVQSVFQMVAVEVLEIRGSRAMRNILNLTPTM